MNFLTKNFYGASIFFTSNSCQGTLPGRSFAPPSTGLAPEHGQRRPRRGCRPPIQDPPRRRHVSHSSAEWCLPWGVASKFPDVHTWVLYHQMCIIYPKKIYTHMNVIKLFLYTTVPTLHPLKGLFWRIILAPTPWKNHLAVINHSSFKPTIILEARRWV